MIIRMTRIAAVPTVLRSISGPEFCEMCEMPGLKTELVRDPFIYGIGSNSVEIVADIPVHTCSSCLISYTGEEAEISRHKAILKYQMPIIE